MALTRRQREIYDFLSRFVDSHGYSPSFEEIAEGVKLSSLATVHKHIGNLEAKGLLKRDYNRARSIDLVKPKGQLKRAFAAAAAANTALPFLGRIAAGQPIEAISNPETISLGDFTGSKTSSSSKCPENPCRTNISLMAITSSWNERTPPAMARSWSHSSMTPTLP